MESIVIQFTKSRETKGTFVYEEDHEETDPPVVRTLYVARHAAAKLGNPEKISVTIAAV